MDSSQEFATKADLKQAIAGLEERLEERLNERHDMLRAEMHHLHDSLVERIADTETKLLQAFYSYAESNQKRVSAVEDETAALKKRRS